jgi:hypothetical protein
MLRAHVAGRAAQAAAGMQEIIMHMGTCCAHLPAGSAAQLPCVRQLHGQHVALAGRAARLFVQPPQLSLLRLQDRFLLPKCAAQLARLAGLRIQPAQLCLALLQGVRAEKTASMQ